MSLRRVMMGDGGSTTTIFSSDGSTLTGWTTSGTVTVDGTLGNPLPCIRVNTTASASRQPVGAKRWKFDIRTGPSSLCDFIFAANSSGAGPMFRLEARATFNSGIGVASSFTTFPTPPSGGSSLGTLSANTWYTVEIVLNGGGTAVDVYVNSVLSLSGISITKNGDYVALCGDGASGGVFDNIIVSSV